jgi:glucose/arabinose dehydrogenase
VHGDDLMDPEYGAGKQASDYAAPVQELGPHTAPLGMELYEGDQFPSEYRGQALIAEHGSWNRTEKIGYRVTLVRAGTDGSGATYEDFATGWLQGEEAWGRPVDLEHLPDGSLLLSDDGAGAIYRISYAGE